MVKNKVNMDLHKKEPSIPEALRVKFSTKKKKYYFTDE